MKILILTDIFGKNSIPKELQLKTITIYEPYEIDNKIADENKLYKKFIDNCGHERYFQQVYKKVMELKPDIIIGFSIGGSVAWRLSNLNISSKVVCFYPSQIRNHLDIIPKVDTTIIFPKKEKHFNLEEIIQKLSQKKNLTIINSSASHGFVNSKSKNYNKNEQDKYIQFILNLFNKKL